MDYFNQVIDTPPTGPTHWANHTFEQCVFRKLDLSQAVLTQASLIDCRFEDCVLTAIALNSTKLYEVSFLRCLLTQVDFSGCDTFGFAVDFIECQLDHAVFLNRKLKRTRFIDCSLKEAHFANCDLSGSVFKGCNLEFAKFDDNNLTQADFSTSYNISLNPEENKVKKAHFSVHSLPGLLTKYNLVISS